MLSAKENQEYIKQEYKNKIERVKLHKEQDKKIIDEMMRTYKIHHAFITLMLASAIVIAILFLLSFYDV